MRSCCSASLRSAAPHRVDGPCPRVNAVPHTASALSGASLPSVTPARLSGNVCRREWSRRLQDPRPCRRLSREEGASALARCRWDTGSPACGCGAAAGLSRSDPLSTSLNAEPTAPSAPPSSAAALPPTPSALLCPEAILSPAPPSTPSDTARDSEPLDEDDARRCAASGAGPTSHRRAPSSESIECQRAAPVKAASPAKTPGHRPAAVSPKLVRASDSAARSGP